jgi:hypothetical protein
MTRRDVSQRRGRFVQACALSWLTWLPEEGAKHISELSRDRVLSLFLAETPHPARVPRASLPALLYGLGTWVTPRGEGE